MEWINHFFLVPEGTTLLHLFLMVVKKLVALIGVVVIVCGSFMAIYQFFRQYKHTKTAKLDSVDLIRLKFGRMIILGLEFIVAADVIETTTNPDYYRVGILAALVGIRTFLTFFMNRELVALSKR